jgi:hypothetical protein
MGKKEKIETNPFKHGKAEEVWKTLFKNSRPVTREEGNRKIKEALTKKKKSHS